jgi:hypothetical protein
MRSNAENFGSVISLADYRERLRARFDGPPSPGPIGGRKATNDVLLAEVVSADALQETRIRLTPAC